MKIHLGFEVRTGKPVEVPLQHFGMKGRIHQ